MGLLISNKGFATNPLSKLHPPMRAHSQYAAFVQKAYPMVASFVILSKSQLQAQPLDWLFTQSHPNKTSRPLPVAPSPCANNAACGSNCYQKFFFRPPFYTPRAHLRPNRPSHEQPPEPSSSEGASSWPHPPSLCASNPSRSSRPFASPTVHEFRPPFFSYQHPVCPAILLPHRLVRLWDCVDSRSRLRTPIASSSEPNAPFPF